MTDRRIFAILELLSCLKIGHKYILFDQPEIHVKCEVHEFVAYFSYRKDIEGNIYRYRRTSVIGPDSSIIVYLTLKTIDQSLFFLSLSDVVLSTNFSSYD